MSPAVDYTLGVACLACLGWRVYRTARPAAPEPPVAAPRRPPGDDFVEDLLLFPFRLVAGLAGLCWCLLGLAVFLAPLAFLALVVAAVVLR